jgi:mxaK protein
MGRLRMLRTAVYRAPTVLLGLLLALAAFEGLRMNEALRTNDRVRNAWRLIEEPGPGATSEWIIAHAQGLLDAGRVDEALRSYQALVAREDVASEQVAIAWYNMGNLYLRQAMREFEAGRQGTAFVRADRAKHAYRRALRVDPAFWDAKYNLETAMYLRPDLPAGAPGGEEATDVPKDAQSELFSLPSGHP